MNIDIPQLLSSGTRFDNWSFKYTYSLQSSSNHSFIYSSIDAIALDLLIMSNSYARFDLIRISTENTTDLIIPRYYFYGEGAPSFILSNNTNLERIVIGDSCFEKAKAFELSNLSQLQSISFGYRAFWYAESLVFRSD